MSDEKSLPLASALDEFIAGEPAYFCIPGHRLQRGAPESLAKRFGADVFKYDLTEAKTLDDLHHASGPILKAQSFAAKLYGAKETRFLVNGTTCGLEALMMALCGDGDEVIAARNSHRSVASGMIMSGARPVWLMPEFDETFGFATEVKADTVASAIQAHPNAKAVFIVSPTYYGTCSDIKAIAEICHENNMPLIVDEAHGAHLYFNDDFPAGALKCGADAVVMSTHKTLGSFTQSSLLHINSERINTERLDAALKITMSSSPSYLLMLSLEAAIDEMAKCGFEITKNALELSMRLRKGLAEIDGVEVYGGADADILLKNRIDPSRVVFTASELGIYGDVLSDYLFDKFSVAIEMSDKICCTAIVTGANTDEDVDRLIRGVKEAAGNIGKCSQDKFDDGLEIHIPKTVMTPREAFFAESEKVSIDNALGRVSAGSVIPYPPGIPLLNPGEIVDESTINVIKKYSGNTKYIIVIKLTAAALPNS